MCFDKDTHSQWDYIYAFICYKCDVMWCRGGGSGEWRDGGSRVGRCG